MRDKRLAENGIIAIFNRTKVVKAPLASAPQPLRMYMRHGYGLYNAYYARGLKRTERLTRK